MNHRQAQSQAQYKQTLAHKQQRANERQAMLQRRLKMMSEFRAKR